MNTLSKKIVSGALTATTFVWASGALSLIPVASAQTATELQAQIAALLAQIQQLQGQLGAPSGGTVSYSFTRNLTLGSRGNDVMDLQKFLNANGAQVAATGPGSPGNESTYFGAKTKAALAKYQASVGISPALGYFGPKTMQYVNSLAVVTPPPPPPSGDQCANIEGVQTTVPAGLARDASGNCVAVVVPPPSGGLAVSLSSDNPVAGSLISGAGRTPILSVNLTAGTASGITVSDIKVKKSGVMSDSSITGAYLTENRKVVAQYSSISSGVVSFSGLAINIAAGQTKTLQFAIDIASGLSAGNTVSFSVAASDVTAWDAANASVAASGGTLTSNIFNTASVSNPSLAVLTIASSSIGTSVTAGTTNNLVGAWNFTAANSRVKLVSVNFKVIGSATKTDIKNAKLLVNGTQVGPTLASVSPNGDAYFDASANPGILNTGSNNIQVYADVMGSPSYNFQFEILNSYDIYTVDSQYGVPVLGSSNVGTQVSILTGTVTVSQAASTPTGNIAPGQSGVVIAKFTVLAAGEAVRVRWLGVGLNIVGATTTIDNLFKNLSLVDDAGGQIGNTITTLSTGLGNGTGASGCTDTAISTTANATSTYRNCFGNSSSPINYIIPGNTTRVLALVADVQSTTNFTSVTGVLTGNTNNLQGLTSGQTASSGSANGSSLTLAASSLIVARNSALGTQTISGGAANRKVGSYAFTASNAEGVKVSNLSITAHGNTWTNLRVMVGSTQFGSTQGNVSSNSTYSFSGSQEISVPAGQTIYVDAYADSITGSTGTQTPATDLSGCSGRGLISFTAISCSSVTGQNIVFAGQSTVTVTAETSIGPSDQLVMGSTGNALAAFRFTETSNVEDVKITTLYIFQQTGPVVGATTSVKSAFGNVQLYQGSALVGTAGAATAATTSGSGAGGGFYYLFNLAKPDGSPVVVPQANSLLLTLKGDVSSYASSGAADNTTHVFKVATTTETVNDTTQEAVVAYGSTSNGTSSVTLSSPTANTQTILRSNIAFNATPLGSTSGRAKSASENLATLSFTASSAGDVAINSVIITFGGSAPTSTFQDGVSLIDNDSGSTLGSGNTSTTACNGTNTCTKTFNLGGGTSGLIVGKGQTKNITLRIDSTRSAAASNGVAQTLTATINAATSILFTDALDGAAQSTIGLPTKIIVPITINSVSYSAGS